MTLADIDYAAFCAVSFTDFESGASVSRQAFVAAHAFAMPEQVERPVHFHGRAIEYANHNDGGDFDVHFSGTAKDGTGIAADFRVAQAARAREPERRRAVDGDALPAELQGEHTPVRGGR